MDLAAEWRSRRWRKLLNVIDGLPRNSHYAEALADDEQLAEVIVALPESSVEPARRMSEFSPEVELLTVIADRLAEATMAIAALGGGRAGQVNQMPRPRTAVQRVRTRRRVDTHNSLVARLLPSKAT